MMRNLAAATVAALAAVAGAGAQPLPSPLVYLRDIDPTIAQDIRYATANNFTGRPLPGYDAAECVLTRDAALALRAVQADLAPAHLSVKVYDCYRPERAVRAMAKWAHDGRADGTKQFYPNNDKSRLFSLGYIAGYSRHSSGTAVDLTLIEKGATPAAFDPAARYGACTEPAAVRAPDNSLDMGTGYDCLDVKGHTASSAVSPEQHRHRMMLVAAMRKRGFSNYFREWWHFTLNGSGGAPHHDVPIRPR
jgi:D-alanyl-D-alanine dipeptidase